MAGLNDLMTDGGSLKISAADAVAGGISNKELMRDARNALAGNWGMAVLGFILYGLLIFSLGFFVYAALGFVAVVSALGKANVAVAINAVSVAAQLLQILLQGAIWVGLCSFFLVIVQKGEVRLECLFNGFKRFWTSFAAFFMSSLFIFLWSLLFVIPGIIAAFRYAMVYFIIADDDEIGPMEAISRSKEMMTGNKWKYFCLNFRFIGWAILCVFTMNIGLLWLVPYMQTSRARFYEDVK